MGSRTSTSTIAAAAFAAAIAFAFVAPLSAQVPGGAEWTRELASAALAGGGAFSAAGAGPAASAANPAASGAEQRTILDAGYLALPGLGAEAGLGHGANLGAVVPTKYGVFGGSLRFVSSPFSAYDVGTFAGLNLNAAKELYPGFLAGAGIGASFGTDWSLGLDLGVRHRIGDLGALKGFTWAAALTGIGKGWAPAAFTPVVGAAFDLVRVPAAGGEASAPDPFSLGAAVDLGFPAFQDLSGRFGLEARVAGIVTIRASTGFDLRDALDRPGTGFLIPSIGVTVNLKVAGKAGADGEKPLLRDGEVAPTIAARPLYDGVVAVGAGATITVGVLDTRPPAIAVDYPEKRWISPNNDGKADDLEFPISITDERYVAAWKLEILDASGTAVRVLRNKEKRIETEGFRGILDRVLYVKSGVDVPATLRWDGNLDSGEVAPDGTYTFVLSAEDDNGNAASSAAFEVAVDSTPPSVELSAPSDAAGGLRILSPDGDGNKDVFRIDQSGSKEDLWSAAVYNALGAKVRTYDAEDAAPASFDWDGKDDSGAVVPDGVYRYAVSAVDRALNEGGAALENVIVNTERPAVSLLIDQAWFSPNGDGIKDVVALSPGVPVKEGVESWRIAVKDAAGAARRTLRGGSDVPAKADFDGKDDAGSALPEGSYKAELTVVYRNGTNAVAASPSFALDLTPPRASARAEIAAFSPNGDGNLDAVGIVQTGTEETFWTGELRGADGKVAKTFRFDGSPAPRIEWDGRSDSGKLAADGVYSYRLSAVDRAGNSGASEPVTFELTTADTPVLLTTDLAAFSPNGDGVKDVLAIAPQPKERAGVASWRIEVLDAASAVVRAFEGTSAVPASVAWNGKDNAGKAAPDGAYSARAEIRYVAGNRPVASSAPFVLDTVAPSIELSLPYALFSPNGDGKRDSLPISVATPGDDAWTMDLLSSSGAVVASWSWKGAAPAIAWDGKDAAGNAAADGAYRLAARSEDAAGNKGSAAAGGIALDARPVRAFLTASAAGISPNGDGVADGLRFGVVLSPKDGIASWKLEVADESGRAVKTFRGEAAGAAVDAAPPSEVLDWDGKADDGRVAEGRMTARLEVEYRKGDVAKAESSPFLVDVTPPRLSLESSPRWFSPDNDGVEDELFVSLGARDPAGIASWVLEVKEPQPPYQVFYRAEGKGEPAGRLIWDGRSNKGELAQAATDYPAVLRARDALGNEGSVEGVLGVDVLVIREGDVLKIKVPSIIFRENADDFNGLGQDVVDNNLRVLKRIAQILNKFRDYKVKVEGHANPVSRTAKEEREELQPLSEKRAKAVLGKLVEFGVDGGRLSAVGMGGTRPVVRWEDYEDWWKNRRVEFILIK